MVLEPITREEHYLAKAGGQNIQTPTPITRQEMFLDAIAKREPGGGGGSGGASIDVTASVGQTIVVEEVDANGKPSKWKAADFPKQGHMVYITAEELAAAEDYTILPQANFDDFAPILYNGGSIWIAFPHEFAGNVFVKPDYWFMSNGALAMSANLVSCSVKEGDVNWENATILFTNGTWTMPT